MGKNEARKKRWPKVIKLKLDKYIYIEKKKKEYNFKTLAGTLDKILNDYQKICLQYGIYRKKDERKLID